MIIVEIPVATKISNIKDNAPIGWEQKFKEYLLSFLPNNLSIEIKDQQTNILIKINQAYFKNEHVQTFFKIKLLNYFIEINQIGYVLPPNISQYAESDKLTLLETPSPLPTISESLPDVNEVEIKNLNFPLEHIPENFICPVSQSIMSIPVCIDFFPNQFFDLKPFMINLWMTGKNPLTNEKIHKTGFIVHSGLMNVIRTFIRKIQYCHENNLDYDKYLNEIKAKTSFEKFLNIINKENESIIAFSEEEIEKTLEHLNNSGNSALMIEQIEPHLDSISESSLKTLCYYALALAHCSVLNQDDAVKYSRYFLANYTKEFHLEKQINPISLVQLLVAIGKSNIGLQIAKRYKFLNDNSNIEFSKNIEKSISSLQYLLGLTALRGNKTKNNRFAKFLLDSQHRYKIRNELRNKLVKTHVYKNISNFPTTSIEKIICDDKLPKEEREKQLTLLLSQVKVTELDQKKAIAFKEMGDKYYKQENYSEAIKNYDQALALNPTYGRAWNNKGLSLQGQKKYNDAIVCHQKAISYEPTLGVLKYNLGLAFEALNQIKEAFDCYNKALEIEPQLVVALDKRNKLIDNQVSFLANQSLDVIFDYIIEIITNNHTNEFNIVINLFKKYPNLLNDIDPTRGISPLFFLTDTKIGRSLLQQHSELRKLITSEGLNKISQREEFLGYSPLYSLVLHEQGLLIIANDSVLREKITAEALSAKTKNGTNVLIFFMGNDSGIRILSNDIALRRKITVSAFNCVIEDGEYKGFTPIFALARKSEGLELLASDSKLREMILPESLEQIVTGEIESGLTPLIYLTDKPLGIKILANDPNLREKISENCLNYAVPDGPYKGLSPLFLLCNNPEGMKILVQDKNLRKKITSEGLSCVSETKGLDEDVSPLFFIAGSKEGLNLLTEDEHLRNKISPEALNYVSIKNPDFKGNSPLLNILSLRPDLLVNNPDLVKKITSSSLETISECKIQNYGISPLFILSGTEAGLKILANNPELRKKITPKGLNAVALEGKHKGISPIFLLLQEEEGCKILFNDPNLLSKIETRNLGVLSQSVNKGLAPIFFLVGTERGLKLLNLSSDLRKKITFSTLTVVCDDGQNKNKYPLLILLTTEKGRHTLMLLINSNENLFKEIFNFFQDKNSDLCKQFLFDVISREGYQVNHKTSAFQILTSQYNVRFENSFAKLTLN